jgi:hypothetical protein
MVGAAANPERASGKLIGLRGRAEHLVARGPFSADRIQPVETAARTVGVDLRLVEVEGPQDLERAFSAMTRYGIGALLVSLTPLLRSHRASLGTWRPSSSCRP